jgi:uncharacterized membrane protein YdjX (TVP38/TMEM64 family)
MEPVREQPATSPMDGAGRVETRPSWWKVLTLALVVCGLLAIVYFSPLRAYLGRLRDVSEQIRGLGWLGPLVTVLGVGLLVAVGFPRLLFCVIAGMAFGFWCGLLWTQLGTLLGNYLVFLGMHLARPAWAKQYVSKRERLQALLRQESIAGVILARQLPLPGVLVNIGCALFCVRHRDFLAGTLLGQLPEAVPCTLIGAGALEASFARSTALIGLAVAVAVALWIGLRWFLRRRSESNTCSKRVVESSISTNKREAPE